MVLLDVRADRMATSNESWKDCVEWLTRCDVLRRDHKTNWPEASVVDLANTLRDGVLLCNLLNILDPGCIDLKDVNQKPQLAQFLCLRNIKTFLQTCHDIFGLKENDLFEPSMLFELNDFFKVLNTLSKLSNCVKVQRKQIIYLMLALLLPVTETKVGISSGNEVGISLVNEVGISPGNEVGIFLVNEVGISLVNKVGISLGNEVGIFLVNKVGISLGNEVGISLGNEVGISLVNEVGIFLVNEVGISLVNEVGISLGNEVGISLGNEVGISLVNEVGISLVNEVGISLVNEVRHIPREQGRDIIALARCTCVVSPSGNLEGLVIVLL
uniref:Calponin-homology (CH) domain-containing protein n=1 Tax=Timema cristinae TaxID=61476 RepID=A0A7R9H2N8_TIMCR|nr:unnamed protein product [Timema cristinae]